MELKVCPSPDVPCDKLRVLTPGAAPRDLDTQNSFELLGLPPNATVLVSPSLHVKLAALPGVTGVQ